MHSSRKKGRWAALPVPTNISRRGFVGLLGGAGALVLGPQVALSAEWSGDGVPEDAAQFGAMLSIAPDDQITIVVPSSEMGQGTQEALARIICEELDGDFDKVRVILPWADPAFNNPIFRRQLTADSRTTTGYYRSLRSTGASARAMLVQAAAARLGVEPATLSASRGIITHAARGQTLTYGEVASDAALLPVPAEVTLKPVKDFTVIGGASKRVDLRPKVTGEAEFGIDVVEPGMLVATVVLGPHPKAELEASGLDEAANSPGVVKVAPVNGGYAVIADKFWRAKKAAEKITLTATSSPNAGLNAEEISRRIEASFDDVEGVNFPDLNLSAFPPKMIPGDKEATLAALADAPQTIKARYEVPYLAHMTLEPVCCSAKFTEDGGLYIRGPLQAPGDIRQLASDLHGLPLEDIRVEVTYLGGGFGRKWSSDFTVIAMQAAKAMPGRLVKTIYTREQDIAADEYRPAFAARYEAGISETGELLGMYSQIAGQSVNTYHGRPGMPGIPDPTVASMLIYNAYDFPNKYIAFHETTDLNVPVGFWRSVALSQNAFFAESMIDEVARATGKDPYHFRREMLAKDPRFVAVLDKVAEMIGWDDEKPANVGRGIGLSYTTNSYAAQIAEVEVVDGALKLRRIVCANDCGLLIDPASVEAQVFGGMIFGLQAALWGGVNFEDGEVKSSNFTDYRMPILMDIPKVEVALIQGNDEPGPIGESATPPIAPAIVNAIADAGGPRIRHLPVSQHLQI